MKSMMTVLLLAMLVAFADAKDCGRSITKKSTKGHAFPGAGMFQKDAGHACKLPFTYKGVTYHACTEAESSGQPWCATDGQFKTDKYWGFCEDACPKPKAKAVASTTAAPTTLAPTTTQTALDSSSSSNSGQSSGSLGSVGSGPTGSFNTGSSVSGSVSAGGSSSGLSASFGSNDASGSWGSQLQIWQWFLIIALCCLCGGGGAAAAIGSGKKRSKKSTKKKAPAAPAPAPAAAPAATEVVEPLLPPLIPLAPISTLTPSYSVAAPLMMAAPSYTYAGAAPQMMAAPAYAYETTTGQVV